MDGNNMLTKENMFTALTHSGGIKGSHAILIDAKQLSDFNHIYEKGTDKKKRYFKGKTGIRATYEIFFTEDINSPFSIFEISNFTSPEVIKKT